MDSRSTDRIDEPTVAETPEDVAVLYSWANLHGAKYRDFSASRREYRAQLRHRAAEQVREQALLAQAEAEAAAAAAESAARHAAQTARSHQTEDADSSMRRALREAEEAARTAAAERVEAARRAEAAAVAEAAARREEREIAEAHASAQRQAARYADSEMRRKAAGGVQQAPTEPPGRISDPYTVASTPQAPVHSQPLLRPTTGPVTLDQTAPSDELRPGSGPERHEYRPYTTAPVSPQRRSLRGAPGFVSASARLPSRRCIRSPSDIPRPRPHRRTSRVHFNQFVTTFNSSGESRRCRVRGVPGNRAVSRTIGPRTPSAFKRKRKPGYAHGSTSFRSPITRRPSVSDWARHCLHLRHRRTMASELRRSLTAGRCFA